MDVGVFHRHVLAPVDETGPVRRIGQLDVSDRNVARLHEPRHLRWTPRDLELVRRVRSVGHLEKSLHVSVDLARPAQGHVLLLDTEDKMPAADVVAASAPPPVLRRHVERVVVGRVWAALQRRAFGEVEVHAALQEHGTAEVRALRKQHLAAARRVRVVDRPLDRRRVLRCAIALRAVVAHVENRGVRRTHGQRRRHCDSITSHAVNYIILSPCTSTPKFSHLVPQKENRR